jgi:hypothetical protein
MQRLLKKILPDYLFDKETIDEEHFHHRRKTKKYKKKKEITKNIWITLLIGVGITTPPLFIITILFFLGTFTSFAILDETE